MTTTSSRYADGLATGNLEGITRGDAGEARRRARAIRCSGEDVETRAYWLGVARGARGEQQPSPYRDAAADHAAGWEEYHRSGGPCPLDTRTTGETVPADCTGYIDDDGHLAHDGPKCPVHESPDERRFVVTAALEAMTGAELLRVIGEGGPAAVVDATYAILGARNESAVDEIAAVLSGSEWTADTAETVAAIVRNTGRVIADVDEPDELPLLDHLASNARTALDDPIGITGLDEWRRDGRDGSLVDVERLGAAVRFAIGECDRIINALNPAELTAANAADVLAVLGRQIEDVRDRMEAEDVIEHGRSLIGDEIAAALDHLDQAIGGLRDSSSC